VWGRPGKSTIGQTELTDAPFPPIPYTVTVTALLEQKHRLHCSVGGGEVVYIIIESKLRGVWKKCGRFIDCHSVLYVWCMFVCTPDVGAHACCSQVVQRRFYVVAWRQPNTKRSMFWYYSSVVWIPVQVDVTTLIPPSQLSEREMVSSELLFCFLTCNVPFSL